jgi:hypothetical protein
MGSSAPNDNCRINYKYRGNVEHIRHVNATCPKNGIGGATFPYVSMSQRSDALGQLSSVGCDIFWQSTRMRLCVLYLTYISCRATLGSSTNVPSLISFPPLHFSFKTYSTLPYGNMAGGHERSLQQVNLPTVSYTVTLPMMYSGSFKNNLMPSTSIRMEFGRFSS